jgi:BirA family biotin operon repressor/biotin-[acetyl-CoA-carboxylase] ligase
MPLNVEQIRALRPDNTLHYFQSIGSTMTEAAQLAAGGAPHGSVVVAEEQTAGVGRLGRSWSSPTEEGIYCSILLRLSLPPASLPVASLMLGLSTAEAIEKAASLACDLRWPNDVLINEQKVAGILTHLVEDCIIAGIGINVNQTSFPADLRTPATSLLLASGGRAQSREGVLVALLASVDAFCALLTAEGPGSILRAFASASSYALNRRIVIEESGMKGVTAGLDENGFLLVESDGGRLERIAAGGVRPER